MFDKFSLLIVLVGYLGSLAYAQQAQLQALPVGPRHMASVAHVQVSDDDQTPDTPPITVRDENDNIIATPRIVNHSSYATVAELPQPLTGSSTVELQTVAGPMALPMVRPPQNSNLGRRVDLEFEKSSIQESGNRVGYEVRGTLIHNDEQDRPAIFAIVPLRPGSSVDGQPLKLMTLQPGQDAEFKIQSRNDDPVEIIVTDTQTGDWSRYVAMLAPQRQAHDANTNRDSARQARFSDATRPIFDLRTTYPTFDTADPGPFGGSISFGVISMFGDGFESQPEFGMQLRGTYEFAEPFYLVGAWIFGHGEYESTAAIPMTTAFGTDASTFDIHHLSGGLGFELALLECMQFYIEGRVGSIIADELNSNFTGGGAMGLMFPILQRPAYEVLFTAEVGGFLSNARFDGTHTNGQLDALFYGGAGIRIEY